MTMGTSTPTTTAVVWVVCLEPIEDDWAGVRLEPSLAFTKVEVTELGLLEPALLDVGMILELLEIFEGDAWELEAKCEEDTGDADEEEDISGGESGSADAVADVAVVDAPGEGGLVERAVVTFGDPFPPPPPSPPPPPWSLENVRIEKLSANGVHEKSDWSQKSGRGRIVEEKQKIPSARKTERSIAIRLSQGSTCSHESVATKTVDKEKGTDRRDNPYVDGKAAQINFYDVSTCVQYIAEATSRWTSSPFVGGTGAITGADCFPLNMPVDSTGINTAMMWEESTTSDTVAPAQANGWCMFWDGFNCTGNNMGDPASPGGVRMDFCGRALNFSTVANITAWRLRRCNHGDRFIPSSDAAIEFIFDFHNPHQFLDIVSHDILIISLIISHQQQQLYLFLLFLSISIKLFSSLFNQYLGDHRICLNAAAINSCWQLQSYSCSAFGVEAERSQKRFFHTFLCRSNAVPKHRTGLQHLNFQTNSELEEAEIRRGSNALRVRSLVADGNLMGNGDPTYVGGSS
ncbi:hypothetical protein C8R45DRAFT_1078232 [Mycena sanguinolenta]|nr:hypothetical protein C8R45DRAFT_1078232 [Mycena sanguinolenta]